MSQTFSGALPAYRPNDIRPTSMRAESAVNSDDRTAGGVGITVDPRRVRSVLFAIVAALVAASASLMYVDYLTGYNSVLIHKLVKLFSVDLELNVPSFFSSLLLLFS